MSDMSSLSHEYASTTDFSRHINDAVLLLKKRYLGSGSQVDDDQFELAKELVAHTVESLRRRLSGESAVCGGPVSIPEDVLSRIEEKHQGNLDYFRQDLAELEQAFANATALRIEDLELLDSICEAADASASATFRKLWRR